MIERLQQAWNRAIKERLDPQLTIEVRSGGSIWCAGTTPQDSRPAVGADAAPDEATVYPAANHAINSIRAHLAEFGIVAGLGRNGAEALFAVIAKGEEQGVPTEARSCLMALAEQLDLVKRQILEMDRRVLACHRASNLSRRLEAIPGVGPLISTALVARVPDPNVFRSGRDLSASIGLVPKQNSSGGRERLGSISKAGNRYLRQLLVVGALALIRRAKQLGYTRRPWLVKLMERRSVKIAAVTLANKMARAAWAMMARGEPYRVTLPA